MRIEVTSSAPHLASVYKRRALRAKKYSTVNRNFALYLHRLRREFILKNIYKRTPHVVTGNLINSEVVRDDSVYNTASYSKIRADMKGNYVRYGWSKEADFIKKPFEDALYHCRKIESRINKDILKG